jgi:hypothetical protein
MSDEMNWMRRKFLQVTSLFGAGFLLGDAASAQHEHHQAPKTEAPKADKKGGKAAAPERGRQKPPGGNAQVITPDLPRLEYKMENGVKVLNLTAEVVEC